jgi:hypothetical protein
MFNKIEQRRVPPVETEDVFDTLRFRYVQYFEANFSYESEAMTYLGERERNILYRHGERFMNIVGGLLHARVQYGQDAHMPLTDRFTRISASIDTYTKQLHEQTDTPTETNKRTYQTTSGIDIKHGVRHVKIVVDTGEILNIRIPFSFYDSLTEREREAFLDSTVVYFGALREIIDLQFREHQQSENSEMKKRTQVQMLFGRMNSLHEAINVSALSYDNE